MAKKYNITPEKAREMLHNPPHGKPLTKKQRGLFGHIANANLGKEIPNYNDSKVTLPEGFIGDGYQSKNFVNPAWGGQFQFGGKLSGAIGNMYARIGAPSNGKYAKKTLPSAKDGTEVSPYYINGLDFKTKGMQMGGSILPDISLKSALFDERQKKRDSVRLSLVNKYTNPIDFDKINMGMLDYYQKEPKEYMSLDVNLLSPERKKQLLKKQKGGVIKDDMGQYNHPGKITQIDSNNITMQGVPYPVIGVSDTGDMQMMYPNNNYQFDGTKVTEYPLNEITKGSKQDKGQLKKLRQLTDFSNNNNMEQAKDGKWIQKAVNPKHKGFCTPMTKATCTPRRKALAKTFKKHHGFHEDGGLVPYAQNGLDLSQYNTQAPNFGPPQNMTYQPLNLGQSQQFSQYGNYQAPSLNLSGQGQSGFGGGNVGGGGFQGLAGGIDFVGNVMKGIKMLDEEEKQRQQAKQFSLVSDVVAKAAESRPEKVKRKYVRPEDIAIQPNQMFPSQGVGTNYLAKNGAEIQNTYAPNNTLYSDLAYEPLDDSNKVKQFQFGGAAAFGQAGGFGLASQIGQSGGGALSGTSYGQPSGGSYLGSTIGGTAGSFFGPVGQMIGETAGGLIGGAIDQTPRQIKKYQEQGQTNLQRAALQQSVKNLQLQNSSFMKDGGWLSHNWNPQVIAKFGDTPVKEIIKPDPYMDTLRSGGNLSNLTYKAPSKKALQTYGLGGELKVYENGHAETISSNPYLPDGGETVMFRGPSHENGGIPISYGKNPVEVEGGEPAIKLQDGGTGEDNLVVFGNMKIPNYGVAEIGDKNAKNKKFKNYIADLSKKEERQNKNIDKGLKLIDETEGYNAFDLLKMNSGNLLVKGSNMKLKEIAEKKQAAADVQNAILDTAQEYNLDSDALAKGKVKKANCGAKITSYQDGGKKRMDASIFGDYLDKISKYISPEDTSRYINALNYNKIKDNPNVLVKKSSETSVPKGDEEFNKWFAREYKRNPGGVANYKGQPKKLELANSSSKEDYVGIKDKEDYKFNFPSPPIFPTSPVKGGPKVTPPSPNTNQVDSNGRKLTLLDAFNSLWPYFRPSNQIPLDPNQLAGEMYALASNQLEPVQAQRYVPVLDQPYDISLQDQLNANQTDFNAIKRLAGNNPAAQSVLAGQKYAANTNVLGEQFRLNQANKANIYSKNRDILNDAQLKNLAIMDQQYVRQSQAKSNTKAIAQSALSSIADKIQQNKLENRTLGVYENLYNYRYDPLGRAYNLNAPYQFNIPQITNLEQKKKARNGSIVKAMKNL